MTFQDKPQSILSFRVGPVLCCAPSLPVESIITPPKLTHPPGSDRAQPGIFRHGSHIVKVIDLRQRFGIEQAEQTSPGNLIITHFGDERFAFWVDQILDVFDFPTEGWGTLPAAIPRGVFSRTLLLNNKIHLYAEFIKLAQLNDLGYLKHYIQQLIHKEAKPSFKISPADKTLKTATTTQEKQVTITPTPAGATPLAPQTSMPRSNSTTQAGLKNDLTHNTETGIRQAKTQTYLNHADLSSHREAKKKTVPAVTSTDERKTTPGSTGNKTSLVNKPAKSATGKLIQQTSAPRVKPVPPALAAASGAANIDPRLTTPVLQPHPGNIAKTITSAESDTEATSSPAMALIFLLLLLVVIGAGIYLFLSTGPESARVSSALPATPALKETAVATEATEENMYNTVPEKTTSPKKTTILAKTTIPAEKTQTLKEGNIKPAKTAPPAYRAEISHQENEITITIHDPQTDEAAEKTPAQISATSEIKSAPEAETLLTTADTVNATLPEKPAVESLKQGELTKVSAKEKPVREIIHVVVKGDTLWAIAKKYVHNPFLYPELARLSNIKNPHRIYPGDRVRIRFVKN